MNLSKSVYLSRFYYNLKIMEIYTSYYGNLKKLKKDGIIPVGISVFLPKYFNGYSLKYLAPTAKMLHMGEKEYTPLYFQILEKVSIGKLREDIMRISNQEGGKDVALLCYEKPGDFCHRRIFADWMKEKTGYDIKEYGYIEKKEPDVVQGSLF